MKITKQWLIDNNACEECREWVLKNYPDIDSDECVRQLLAYRFDWANWLVVHLMMDYQQKIHYAIFAAEQVLSLYESKFIKEGIHE